MKSSFAHGLRRPVISSPGIPDPAPQSRLRAALMRGLALLLPFLVLAGGLAAPVQAQDTQAVANGVSWLQTQVRPDGSLANEDGSVAAAVQARAETATTLKLLASVPPALQAAIAAESDDNTEYLARQAVSLAQSGAATGDLVARLTARQNDDGGFGGSLAFASNPLDTAWALLALNAANAGNAGATAGAVGYLLRAQASGGGFGIASDAPSPAITALVASALQANGSSPAALDALNRANAWLLSAQDVDGGWGNVPDTASVYLALLGSVSDSGLQTSAKAYLLARQASDGGWDADPFATALALRALVAQARPVPTTGNIVLHVSDRATGQPLAGASAMLQASPAAPAVGDASGMLSFSGVAAGSHTVIVGAPGYGAQTLNFTLRAGTTADLGTFALNVAPTTGVLKGVIKDATTGLPLRDATVTVAGSANAATNSGADGAYSLSGLAPGAVAIMVAKAGYTEVSAAGTLVAGAALVFSPTLSLVGQPGDTAGTLIGRTVDAATQAPLAGVTVSVGTSGLAATSGADGSFNLAGIAPGTYPVSFTRAGYASKLYGAVLVAAGSATDFQVLGMNKALDTVVLQGSVTDIRSARPIAMATVAIAGTALSTQTDANGNYRIEGLATGAATVRFSASGYTSETVATSFAAAGEFKLDKTLALDGGSNPAFAGLSTDQAVYPAYAPVTVRMEVANTGAEVVDNVVVDVTVFGPQGQVVNYQQAIRMDTDGVAQNHFSFPPASSTAIDAKWSTQASPPGSYQVKARLFTENAASGARTVLAERSTAFAIEPSRKVLRLAVTPLPGFSTFDATEQLSFKVEASHQSNEALSVGFTLAFKDPAGTVIRIEEGSIALQANDVLGSAVVGPFAHHFAASGVYPVLLGATGDVVPQAVVGGEVQVAPGIRVEPVQQVTPTSITPDGAKRIRVQLQLKGVEQK